MINSNHPLHGYILELRFMTLLLPLLTVIAFVTVLLVPLSRPEDSQISHPVKSSIDRGGATTITKQIFTKLDTTSLKRSKNILFLIT
jgi:hypothetical protein